MMRELKGSDFARKMKISRQVAAEIPMMRELKVLHPPIKLSVGVVAAEIPMMRELKDINLPC